MANKNWDFKRVYSAVEAVNMTGEMKDGAWKGRIGIDDLNSLKRVLMGNGKPEDFNVLEEYGLNPDESPWEG